MSASSSLDTTTSHISSRSSSSSPSSSLVHHPPSAEVCARRIQRTYRNYLQRKLGFLQRTFALIEKDDENHLRHHPRDTAPPQTHHHNSQQHNDDDNDASAPSPLFVSDRGQSADSESESDSAIADAFKALRAHTQTHPQNDSSESKDDSDLPALRRREYSIYVPNSEHSTAALPASQSTLPSAAAIARAPSSTFTFDYVNQLFHFFSTDGLLEPDMVLSILRESQTLFRSLPNVVHYRIVANLNVIGERNAYIFNGDFVDRGTSGLEICLLLFLYKILLPDSFHLNRGNHEEYNMNVQFGFQAEIYQKYAAKNRAKYKEKTNPSNNTTKKKQRRQKTKAKQDDDDAMDSECEMETTKEADAADDDDADEKENNNDVCSLIFNELLATFSSLPLALVVDDEIFITHGGLSDMHGGRYSLDHLQKIERFHSSILSVHEISRRHEQQQKEQQQQQQQQQRVQAQPRTALSPRTRQPPQLTLQISDPPLPPPSMSDHLFEGLLWSDPSDTLVDGHASPSPRGAGVLFGWHVTDNFLRANGLKLLIRSHELQSNGLKFHHRSRVITLFSASIYCGFCENLGALLKISAAATTAAGGAAASSHETAEVERSGIVGEHQRKRRKRNTATTKVEENFMTENFQEGLESIHEDIRPRLHVVYFNAQERNTVENTETGMDTEQQHSSNKKVKDQQQQQPQPITLMRSWQSASAAASAADSSHPSLHSSLSTSARSIHTLEEFILGRIIRRIAVNRFGLYHFFRVNVDRQRTNLMTPQQWAQACETVLFRSPTVMNDHAKDRMDISSDSSSSVHSGGSSRRRNKLRAEKDLLEVTAHDLGKFPFLRYSVSLGVPAVGVDGKPHGAFDYVDWLLKYRPINLKLLQAIEEKLYPQAQTPLDRSQSSILRSFSFLPSAAAASSNVPSPKSSLQPPPPPPLSSSTSSPSSASLPPSSNSFYSQQSLDAVSSLTELQSMFFEYRFDFLSFFRFLDTSNRGILTWKELLEGIFLLNGFMKKPLKMNEIERMIQFLQKTKKTQRKNKSQKTKTTSEKPKGKTTTEDQDADIADDSPMDGFEYESFFEEFDFLGRIQPAHSQSNAPRSTLQATKDGRTGEEAKETKFGIGSKRKRGKIPEIEIENP